MDVLVAIGPALAVWTAWLVRRAGASPRWYAAAVIVAIGNAMACVIASRRIAHAFDAVAQLSADQRQHVLSQEIAHAQWLRAGALSFAAAWGIALAIATMRRPRLGG